MNGSKDKAAVITDGGYVILGATGNTGSIVADFLLSKGEKVRVIGRDVSRLQRFVRKETPEAFTANISDSAALTKSLQGCARSIPAVAADHVPRGPEREKAMAIVQKPWRSPGHALCGALEQLRRACPAKARVQSLVCILRSKKLNAISGLNVLHLRAAYFMENNLAAIGMIQDGQGIFGHALLPDLKLPMIATRDVGDYAARRSALDLDFSGKQDTRTAWRARLCR